MKKAAEARRSGDDADAGWVRFDSMSPAQRSRAARADVDAPPLTSVDMARMKRTPQVRVIRRALGLTQQEFSARFRIPLGTLRRWELNRAAPNQPARAYLQVIARDPDGVARALGTRQADN